MSEIALDPTRLVIAAVIGLVILLVLIIRFKLPAMIAILVGAVLIGLGAGMSFDQIVKAVDDGMGNTLKGIALLVGLGSMFGSILEISGGARTLAVTMVDKFGDRKAAWALAITGLVIAMPVFFDAGLIILIPLAFSLAKRTGRSSLYYVIPLLAGLAVEFFKDKDEIRHKWELGREFKPCEDREYVQKCLKGWHRAVKCALSWSDDKD